MATNATQKRPRPEDLSSEPQTPSAKRQAMAKAKNTPHLTPEARRKRVEQIKAIQAELASTPTPKQNISAASNAQAGSSAQGMFKKASPISSIESALLDARPVTPTSVDRARASKPVPPTVIDEEEEFWLSTPSAVARPPRGEFSAAGYHPSTSAKAGSSATVRSSMPTPPQSSPALAAERGSPSSTAHRADLDAFLIAAAAVTATGTAASISLPGEYR